MSTDTSQGKIPRRTERLFLALAGVLVLAIGGLAYTSNAAFRSNIEQADITHQVVDLTDILLSALTDAETGQRGFLLTADEQYLVPYRDAIVKITPAIDELIAIQARRHRLEQRRRVEQLKPLVSEKLAELAKTIELRRRDGIAASIAVVRSGRGREAMERIRALCRELQAASYAYALKETADARRSAAETALTAVLGSGIIFALLAMATMSIEKGTQRRLELIAALEDREREVRQSRDWLHTTLSSIGDAVITTDGQGRITLLNVVAQKLTGWTQPEAEGKPLETVFVIRNEDTGTEVENPVAKVLREGCVVGLANHTELIAKDGRRVPIDDSAAPIRSSDGQINGVVLVFRDISERKHAEREISLGIDSLRVSNAALVRANDDLNQFAFAASHDLQEPLRMITSYSQLLVRGYRGQLDNEAGMCIQYITEGTQRMSELLADLLAYTQVTGDDQPVETVDLNGVLETAVANCRLGIEQSGARLTCERLPKVRGYEPHFVQVFQNLISNSLKYQGSQPPEIRIFAEEQGSFVRIAVKDNGIGIPPEYHKQVFGVFKRLHGKNIPGTGIGLAICQRVVFRYGGDIWVESKGNEGSTFYFTLPTAEKGAAAQG